MLLLGLESMRRGPTFSSSPGELGLFCLLTSPPSHTPEQVHNVTSIQTLIVRRYYWPPNDQVRDWLEPNWDAWVMAPPQWFTSRFVKRIISAAPPEVLPLTVLRDLAEKYWEEQQEFGPKNPESEAGGSSSSSSSFSLVAPASSSSSSSSSSSAAVAGTSSSVAGKGKGKGKVTFSSSAAVAGASSSVAGKGKGKVTFSEPTIVSQDKAETKAKASSVATSANNMKRRRRSSTRQLGHQQSSVSSRRWSRQVENTSHEELVRMEAERRANKAFEHAKQLWIWAAALVFSYVDLVTTAVVGLQYLDMGTAQGTSAAHVTFAMLGVSVGVQALATHLTGMQLLPLHRLVCAFMLLLLM